MTYQPKHFKPGEAPASRGGGILTVFGHPGVGKTKFCVESGDVSTPLFYCNFDRDAAHLLKEYKGEGGVYYEEFTALTQQQAQACLDKLEGMKNAAMSCGKGVFVIDNVAAAWDIIKLAKVNNLASAMPKQYEPANTWMRDFMLGLERSGVWCILTAPPKEIWSGAKTSTGMYEAEGWKHTDYHVVAEIWLYTTRPLGPVAQPEGSGNKAGDLEMPKNQEPTSYKAQIVLSKKRPAVEGMIMTNPKLSVILKAMKELA